MDATNYCNDKEGVVVDGAQQHVVVAAGAPGDVVHEDAGDGLGILVKMDIDEEDGDASYYSSSSSCSSSSSSAIVVLGVKEGQGRRGRHSTSSDSSPAAVVVTTVVVAPGARNVASAAGQQQDEDEREQEQDLSSGVGGREDEDENRVLPVTKSKSAGRKDVVMTMAGGRTINECWGYLTTEIGQHLVTETRCMKCGQMVRHHKKSEKVKAHLNRCRPFLNSLRSAGLFDTDIPPWVVLKNDTAKKKMIPPARRSKNRLFASPDTIVVAASSSSTPASIVGATSTTTTATSKTRTNTMHDYLIPPLSSMDLAAFQEEIAMHFYMCATPFSRMEEPHFLQALKKLRPDVKLPSRKDLSGRLLRSAHKKVKAKVDAWFKKDQFACITSDAWSNIKNESVINYMTISGDVTFFLESTQSGEQSHTSEYLASDIDRVIGQTHGKIAGVVMDNTAANKKAWKLLKEQHSSMFFQGCVAHGLHLLVKDIFSATKSKSNRPVADYPDGYPFEPLLIFVADCKKVVKFTQLD
jgi:Protein of unknown function (DUF 659)